MILVGTIIVLVLPIFIIIKDLFLSSPPDTYAEWILGICVVNFISLPIISGFIITCLVQREYQEHTIVNMLTAPVSRNTFVLTKLVIWFIWYLIMLVLVEAIVILGYWIIYPTSFDTDGIKMIIQILTIFGLSNFIASIHLLWITIIQKKLFYPSILGAMGFTVILIAGANTSLEMMMLASIVPWSASSVISIGEPSTLYLIISISSIVISGALGLLLSLYSFMRQDQ